MIGDYTMKKLFTLFLALILMISFSACSSEKNNLKNPHETTIGNSAVNSNNRNTTGKFNETAKDITGPENKQAGTGDCLAEKDEIEISGQLKVHFIDVGQADSILIQEANGKSMLIDAGNNEDADFVVNYIKEQGVDSLEYIIGTHPHEDHIGGLDAVIDNFNIGKIIMPKVSNNTKSFEDVLMAVNRKNLKITSPVPEQDYELGDATFTILGPNSDAYDSLNNYSVVIRLEFWETSFVFTGDAETESENEMLSKGYNLKADVLKVGHHGSITSSSMAFIKAIAPKYSIISVSKDNSYGHPDSIILNRLKTMNVEVLRTDELGTIIFTSNGTNLNYETNKNTNKNNIENSTQSDGITETTSSSDTTTSPGNSSSDSVMIENIDPVNEIVIIKNHSNTDIDMTGWKLISVKGNQVYNFPNNFILKAGASITIASGNSEGDLKWTNSNIWNNNGDPGELYDNKGNLVSSK